MQSARITGVKPTCHGLRHTFGVTATRKGIQLHILQRWMGHASMATTAIYADVSGPDDRSLMERMWDGGDPEPPTTPPYLPAHMRQALDKVRDFPFTRFVEGGVDVMVTQFMAAIPRSTLNDPLTNLSEQFAEITAALDMVFQGF